ncbi:DUF2851 family protein [Plebeiibacterium marinum]|uniref:DUF2851 family protein n=1 Tax=Plebeiibacterium marinum TaxID=2992111 RepID=A0AAE3SHT2_9BACT|nr:DUF2851 family protein [Plebeiobacterium marinum]MCW3804005.1 DUF2851 family protein [Plebeiobacterium marinum]
MTEEFLHYIWKHKLYNQKNLTTICNQSIEVISPGESNADAGPDFFNSKIKINGTLWAGNVEVHTDLMDWHVHKHDVDKAYDSVILHVVVNGTGETKRTNGEHIPVLKISWSDTIWQKYVSLTQKTDWLACCGKLAGISLFEKSMWMQRMLIERLEQRALQIQAMLKQTTSNWDETFYRLLFRSFGFGVNSDPFELLASSIPLTVLLKYTDDLNKIEALLLGQAGFLNQEFSDDVLVHLQNEYHFISRKHCLKSVDNHLWRFLRLRPSNFPTIRIAQLAALLFKIKGLFGELINEKDLNIVIHKLSVETSPYWETHYLLDKKSEKSSRKLGESSKNLIIINTLIPFLFAYGKVTQNHEFEERAFEWLNRMKPERNAIVDKWKDNEMLVKNAGDSQALIYLSKNYCKKNKCLLCNIGHKVLSIKDIE